MQLFFGDVLDNTAIIQADEARHAVKVLRKKPGDPIQLINGKGSLYHCEIVEIHRDKVLAKVLEEHKDFGHIPYQLHVAICPTKNIDRFEWFLEKATEMGISSVYPILTKHSERTNIKAERLERILLSAAKQSLKGTVPTLHPLQKFSSFIETPFTGLKYIAHCAKGEKLNFLAEANPNIPTLVCIGPEGDFNADEINMAAKTGFLPITLGSARLRTETAGIVAVSAMYGKV